MANPPEILFKFLSTIMMRIQLDFPKSIFERRWYCSCKWTLQQMKEDTHETGLPGVIPHPSRRHALCCFFLVTPKNSRRYWMRLTQLSRRGIPRSHLPTPRSYLTLMGRLVKA